MKKVLETKGSYKNYEKNYGIDVCVLYFIGLGIWLFYVSSKIDNLSQAIEILADYYDALNERICWLEKTVEYLHSKGEDK